MIYFAQIIPIPCVKRTLEKFKGKERFKWCGLSFAKLDNKWWQILKQMKSKDCKCQLYKED